MTVTLPNPAATAASPQDTQVPKRTAWAAALSFVRRQPLGTFGLVIVVVMFLAGGLATGSRRSIRRRTTSPP